MPVKVKIREMREKRNLNQTQLADRLGVPKQWLSKHERGQFNSINYTLLGRLCEELGCEVGDLLAYVPEFKEVNQIDD